MSEHDPARHRRRWWIPLTIVGAVLVSLAGGCALLISRIDVATSGGHRGAAPPPSDFGTAREIGTHGDDPNPGAMYRSAFPSNSQTQERSVGGPPARFSGYTTWVRTTTRVPARRFVDGYAGSYLRVHVTVFNRDRTAQTVCACDFAVWTRSAGLRTADVVSARTLSPDTEMGSGARLDGDVYLYVGRVPGPYFVIYDPDGQEVSGAGAYGVWRVAT